MVVDVGCAGPSRLVSSHESRRAGLRCKQALSRQALQSGTHPHQADEDDALSDLQVRAGQGADGELRSRKGGGEAAAVVAAAGVTPGACPRPMPASPGHPAWVEALLGRLAGPQVAQRPQSALGIDYLFRSCVAQHGCQQRAEQKAWRRSQGDLGSRGASASCRRPRAFGSWHPRSTLQQNCRRGRSRSSDWVR